MHLSRLFSTRSTAWSALSGRGTLRRAALRASRRQGPRSVRASRTRLPAPATIARPARAPPLPIEPLFTRRAALARARLHGGGRLRANVAPAAGKRKGGAPARRTDPSYRSARGE